MKVLLSRFLLPITISIILVLLIFNMPVVRKLLFSLPDNTPVISSTSALNYYPGLNQHPEAWIVMKKILTDTAGILLMGSSELSSDDPHHAKTFYFLPENTPYSVVAVGHAGNQALSIYTQLLSLNLYLKEANIVIILSPIWYLGLNAAGTSLDVFLEFGSRPALRNILLDKEIPLHFKQYLYDYIALKYPDLISPTPELKLMNHYSHSNKNLISSISYAPLIFLDKTLLSYSMSINNIDRFDKHSLPENFYKPLLSKNSQQFTPGIQWDSLYQAASGRHLSAITSNTWGINDEYYATNVHGEHGMVKVVPMNKNRELRDLMQLVDLLKYYKVNALFVMQSVNPFYYQPLIKFKAIDDSITNIIHGGGFPYYNMMEYDTLKYNKAILTDVMHMSEYGWLTVDRFILENLKKNEKRN